MKPDFAISQIFQRLSEFVVDCLCHGGGTELRRGWSEGAAENQDNGVVVKRPVSKTLSIWCWQWSERES
jgi:hypothetical protein